MTQQHRSFSLVVLVLLTVAVASWSIDPQTNPHRDAGAVRKANNGSDFLDAATVRGNLNVPSVAQANASDALRVAALATITGDIATIATALGTTTSAIEAAAASDVLRVAEIATLTGEVATITTALSDAAASDTIRAAAIASNTIASGVLDAHLASGTDPHGTLLTQTNASMTRLDVSGDVGIGTSTPQSDLHNIGNTRLDGLVYSGSVASVTESMTVTAETGTITAYTATATYHLLGSQMFFSANIVITTKGTAGGAMFVTLPGSKTARTNCTMAAFSGSTGNVATGMIYDGGTTIQIRMPGIATPFLEDGVGWLVSGVVDIGG